MQRRILLARQVLAVTESLVDRLLMSFEFFSQSSKENLLWLFGIFSCLAVLLLMVQWRSKQALGLPLVYAFTLSVIHAVTAYIHTMPKYTPKHAMLVQSGLTLETTYYGFRMMVFGFGAFLLGVLICPLFIRKETAPRPFVPCREMTTMLPGTLVIVAFLSFFVFAPIFRLLPSLGTLTTAGCSCSVAGVYLYCWQAYQQHNLPKLTLGLLSTAVIPMITMIFMGFAGYGASAAAVIWLLVLSFYRPRWLSLTVLALILYVGLSFFLNWMIERDYIRDAVRDQYGLGSRVDRVARIFDDFQLLDFSRQDHLEVLDSRLNQNDLAGKAWRQLDTGRVHFANGETLLIAAIAWVPRILWPGKPVTGGGGDMVTRFTGQRFSEGTSVGAGQVMEFYVNFGWTGLFVGFLLFGIVLRWMDMRAAARLAQGDQWGCARWLLPAIGLIQPGGQMSEVIGSTAAFAVFGTIVHHLLFKKFYDVGLAQPVGQMNRRSSGSRRRYT